MNFFPIFGHYLEKILLKPTDADFDVGYQNKRQFKKKKLEWMMQI